MTGNVSDLIAEAREVQALIVDGQMRQYGRDDTTHLLDRLADALEQSQPGEVATVEQLDALPVGTVILAQGLAVVRDHEALAWWVTATDESLPIGGVTLPATILFTPPQNGEPA